VDAPWRLTFSYGRALQQTALHTWSGKTESVAAAQDALLKRARLNHMADTGGIDSDKVSSVKTTKLQ